MIPKSKRLNLTIFAFILNMAVICYGVYKGSNVTELGTGLVMIDTLIFGYVYSETKRPSEQK